jgi:type I restriction enzyme S subunit
MEVKEFPFTELLSNIVDNRGRTCPTAATGIPLIATNCVRNDLLYPAFEKIRHVSTEIYENWFRGHPAPGDLIFVCKGTPGRVCMTPDPVSFCIAQDMVAVRADPKKVYPKYLFALLRSSQVQAQIGNMHVGTLIPHFKKGDFDKLLLPVPDEQTQKTIGDTYFELSAKIELNRRMNATLEAMARALFQSWFVDFDPVRAKLDGRPPEGMDAETAALFPASFQDSELGHIPKGWTVGRVADVSDFSRSSINPGEFPDETFDHYSLPAFDEGRTPKAELGSAIMSTKLVVTRNSVLLSKLNPHIPRIWLPDLHNTRRSVCSTEFIVASTRPGYSREFLFSLFTSAAFASIYGTLVTGTTGSHQRIRPESVLEMKTVIPPPKLVEAFTTIAKPMFDQINRNIDQSRTLATLRDTLLPKLLSGELSVANFSPMQDISTSTPHV